MTIKTTYPAIYKYGGLAGDWQQVGVSATSIAAGNGILLCRNAPTTSLWMSANGAKWQQISNKPTNDCLVMNSAIFVIDTNNDILRYQGKPNAWEKIGRAAKRIFSAHDMLYCISDDRSIWQWMNSPNSWENIGYMGQDISECGTQMAMLAFENAYVYLYDGTPGKWTTIGHSMSAISGTSEGLYGIDAHTSALMFYKGDQTWAPMGIKAKAISATLDSKGREIVFIINAEDDSVWKYYADTLVKVGAAPAAQIISADGETYITSREEETGLTNALLDSLIKRYAPIVHLDQHEQYHMCAVEWYLERANLVENATGKSVQATPTNLPQGQENGQKYHLSLKDPSSRSGAQDTAKAYVHVNEGSDYWDIQFWFFYAYNGNGTLGLTLSGLGYKTPRSYFTLAPFGEHEADWEHVTLRIDKATHQLREVCMSQHGDPTWFAPNQLQRFNDQVVIFASLNGHASFPTMADNPTFSQDWTWLGTGLQFCLINRTSAGPAMLDSAKNHQVISAPMITDGPPQEPLWVNFWNRWGMVYDRHLTSADLYKIISDQMSGSVMSIIAHLSILPWIGVIFRFFETQSGPSAPISTKDWHEN